MVSDYLMGGKGSRGIESLAFVIALGIGVVFLCGVLITVWHLFTLKAVEEGASE